MVAAASLLLGAGSAAGQPRPDRTPPAGIACQGDPPFNDAVARIEGLADIVLASGRTVRVVDLRFAGSAQIEAAAEGEALAWLRTLSGRAVRISPAGTADRWHRVPATVALLAGAAPIDLGELLVGEGLATVDPGERDGLCVRSLLRIEADARRGGRGIWRGGAGTLDAHDPDRLAGRAGSFAVVEGRVASVGVRRERTYLNFGRDFARDFAVVLPRRTWARMEAEGHDAVALRNRRIRVRGTIELRRAPAMEIVAADVIEVLDGRGPGR